MKMYKITSLIYLDFMIFKNAKWRLVEFLYFPISTVIIWGLFSSFVSELALEAGLIVLMANIFWTFAYLAQSTVNMQMNEDLWSGSIRQIVITGVTEFEYLVARIISATLISLVIMAAMFLISLYAFHITIISSHLAEITILSLLTLVGSIGLAVFVAGAIFLAGVEYAFLGWSIIQIFMLFSAPFYPVSTLPAAIQPVAWAMPFTAVFENIRSLIATGAVSSDLLAQSLAVSLIYIGTSLVVYYFAFRYARKTGRLARMD